MLVTNIGVKAIPINKNKWVWLHPKKEMVIDNNTYKKLCSNYPDLKEKKVIKK